MFNHFYYVKQTRGTTTCMKSPITRFGLSHTLLPSDPEFVETISIPTYDVPLLAVV